MTTPVHKTERMRRVESMLAPRVAVQSRPARAAYRRNQDTLGLIERALRIERSSQMGAISIDHFPV